MSSADAQTLVSRAIKSFIESRKITFTAQGRPLVNGNSVTEASLLNHLRLYAVDMGRIFKRDFDVKLTYSEFVSGWELYKPEAIQAQLNLLRERVAFSEESARKGRTNLEKWLHGMLFRPPTEVETAVMLHFLWQTKRKLFGKPASYHMMPVFVSAQGTGKTTAIQELIKPLEEVVSNTTLEQFTDQRSWATLSRTFIKVVDEMAKAERADIATLKMALSAEGVLEYRPMRSNDLEQVTQNNTFIGTSNEEISGLIRDYTGVRRFFQIVGYMLPIHELDRAEKLRYWKMREEVDAVSIWQSVDEKLNLMPEFEGLQEQIATEQIEELQLRTSFYEFMDTPGYGYKFDVTGKVTKAREIYDHYVTFCEHHGLEPSYSALRIPRILKKRAPVNCIVTQPHNRAVSFRLIRLTGGEASSNLTLLKVEGNAPNGQQTKREGED